MFFFVAGAPDQIVAVVINSSRCENTCACRCSGGQCSQARIKAWWNLRGELLYPVRIQQVLP